MSHNFTMLLPHCSYNKGIVCLCEGLQNTVQEKKQKNLFTRKCRGLMRFNIKQSPKIILLSIFTRERAELIALTTNVV